MVVARNIERLLHNQIIVRLQLTKFDGEASALGQREWLIRRADWSETAVQVINETETHWSVVALRDTQLQPLERRELLVRLVTPLGAALHPLPSEETGSSADLARLLPPETGTV